MAETFDERQLKEIAWALLYMDGFVHGTVGHNQLIIIAKMARELGYSVVTTNKRVLMRNGVVVLEIN